MYGVEVESGTQVRREVLYFNGKLRYLLACHDRRKFKYFGEYSQGNDVKKGSWSNDGDGGESRHLKSEFTLFRNSSLLFHVDEFFWTWILKDSIWF